MSVGSSAAYKPDVRAKDSALLRWRVGLASGTVPLASSYFRLAPLCQSLAQCLCGIQPIAERFFRCLENTIRFCRLLICLVEHGRPTLQPFLDPFQTLLPGGGALRIAGWCGGKLTDGLTTLASLVLCHA